MAENNSNPWQEEEEEMMHGSNSEDESQDVIFTKEGHEITGVGARPSMDVLKMQEWLDVNQHKMQDFLIATQIAQHMRQALDAFLEFKGFKEGDRILNQWVFNKGAVLHELTYFPLTFDTKSEISPNILSEISAVGFSNVFYLLHVTDYQEWKESKKPNYTGRIKIVTISELF